MKCKNKLIKILLAGILLSLLTKVEGKSEPQNTRTSHTKFWAKDRNFANAKDITHQVIGSRITTRFSPKNSLGEKVALNKLASDLGYDHFNWVNYVEQDPYGITDWIGRQLSTPYNDPPKGGYQYDSADMLPFYWDIGSCDRCKSYHHIQNSNNLNQFELVFHDSPADYRLQPGESVDFVTSLVGVKKYSPVKQTAEWEILHTFRWRLTNPYPGYGKVSLIEVEVTLSELSPQLLHTMQLDGAILPNVYRSPI
jgi:hypothetical protein